MFFRDSRLETTSITFFERRSGTKVSWIAKKILLCLFGLVTELVLEKVMSNYLLTGIVTTFWVPILSRIQIIENSKEFELGFEPLTAERTAQPSIVQKS